MMKLLNLGITLAITLCSIKSTEGSAKMKIQFLSFENPDHRLSNGKCCEEGLEKDCTRNDKNRCVTCTMECDSQFKITMKENGNSIFYCNTSTLSFRDKFDFGKTLTPQVENPFVIDTESYKGPFTLSVASYDDDEHLGIDLIDEYSWTFNSSTHPTSTQSTIYTMAGAVSFINVTITVSCDSDYYGQDCDTFCQSRNNNQGHYTCEQGSGQIVCLRGWTDTNSNCTIKDTSVIYPSSSSAMHQHYSIYSTPSLTPIKVTQLLEISSTPAEVTQQQTSLTPVEKTQRDTSSRPVKVTQRDISSSKSPKMSQQKIATSMLVASVKESAEIKPTISEQTQPETSRYPCTSIEKTNFDLILHAELTELQLNETVLEIICLDVNKVCYGVNNLQCNRTVSRGQINIDDVSIQRFETNKTSSYLKLEIQSANGTCNSHFSTCTSDSILKSTRMRISLGIERITVCKNNEGACTSRTTSDNTGTNKPTDKKTDYTGLIVGLVCGLVGVALLVLVALLYLRKKRIMKVWNQEPEKKSIPGNEDNDSNTSAF